MAKTRVNQLPKYLVLISLLIVSILLFISIINEYAAHKRYLEYQKISNNNIFDKRVPEKQIHLLTKNVSIFNPNADALFELGNSFIDKMSYAKSKKDKHNLYNTAKDFFLKALVCKPTDGKHWARYAWHIGLNGETNEAIECFRKAIYLQESDPFVHSLYARWCVNLVKSKIDFVNPARCAEMTRNIRKEEKYVQYYDNRFINGISITAFLEKAQIEWDKAISLKATGNDPTFNNIAYNSLADLALIKCNLDKAIGNYNATGNKIMMAKCYFIKGDYKNTVNLLDSIISGKETKFLENLPIIRNLLNDVIKEDTSNYLALYSSGTIYNRLKRQRLALQDFKAVVKLNPKHIDARLELAKIYKSNGKLDLAMNEYETIISLNPNHKEAVDLLSKALRGNN